MVTTTASRMPPVSPKRQHNAGVGTRGRQRPEPASAFSSKRIPASPASAEIKISTKGRNGSPPPPRSSSQPTPIAQQSPGISPRTLKSTRHNKAFRGNASKTSLGEETYSTMEDSNQFNSPNTTKSTLRAGKTEDTRVHEVTEFHECIYAQDWEFLEKTLKKFNSKYYQKMRAKAEKQKAKKTTENGEGVEVNSTQSASSPISPHFTSPRGQQSARSILRFLPGKSSNLNLMGSSSDDNNIVSPLLKVDDEGRTPLHLAYIHECPEKLLLQLQKEEPLAVRQADNFGQLPLHVAMLHRQHDHILDALIKLHPNALKMKDLQGKTPIGCAVNMAQVAQEKVANKAAVEDPAKSFQWGTPRDDNEKAWQFEQWKIWGTVNFLLSYLMRRKKTVIPSEHTLLLEALEAGGSPKVINRLISTTDKYLIADDDFSGSALALCVDRNYPLDTLEYLVEHCREGSTVVTDYTDKTLVAHYRRGCQPSTRECPSFGKEILDWSKENKKNVEEASGDDISDAKAFLGGASVHCREWWNLLRFVLFLAAHGKNFSSEDKQIQDKHMLHASLVISAVPPSLVQLLLVVFPEARSKMCPMYKVLPIHLACTKWRYDVLRNDKDSSLEKVLKMFLKTDKEQATQRYYGRLPLHMALSVGQSWCFVKPFISLAKRTVGMRDPQTKLFPFQLAAVKISSKNIAMALRQRYTPSEWQATHPSQKKQEFDNAREQQARRQIGTIFELLRRHPNAIAGKYLVEESLKGGSRIDGAGPIATHYLRFMYHYTSHGWRLNPSHVHQLRDSVSNGYVAKPLVDWWEQMQNCIWKTTPSDMIPVVDDFLLHAALYNPDTPPVIIELLLALFPMAAAKPIPRTTIYPLHIAAGTAAYHPQSFEVPYAMNSLELTLNAYKRAVGLTVNGQLSLHMALSRGKIWEEIRPLVKLDKNALLVSDPISKLLPFKLIASFRITSTSNMVRFAQIVAKKTRGINLDELPVSDRGSVVRHVKRQFDCDILSTIYKLVRMTMIVMRENTAPNALAHGAPSKWSAMCGSVETDSLPSSNGNMANLERYLHVAQETPSTNSKLSSFLEMEPPRRSRNHVSPLQRREFSLANFSDDGSYSVEGRNSSSVSVNSRSIGMLHIHDDYIRPSYDDDVSSMGGSLVSLERTPEGGKMKPTSGSASASGSKYRARTYPRSKLRMLAVPSLDTSGHSPGK